MEIDFAIQHLQSK